MIATLEDVTEKLIRDYNPERIILFGSHGTEEQSGGSDIDLLIIKKTPKRPVDRRIEVERLLSPRSLSLDLTVYTPDEVRELFSAGSPFIEEILETGRLLYMRKATAAWTREAEEELASALILCEHEKYRPACYHSQQCVEKALKALILEKGSRPGKTHDIVKLLHQVEDLGWAVSLELDDAVFLNSIYKGRYPTEDGLLPHGDPSKQEAERAIEAARAMVAELKALG